MAISIPDVLFAYLFSHKKGTTTYYEGKVIGLMIGNRDQ
jgi:hypothetical protein